MMFHRSISTQLYRQVNKIINENQLLMVSSIKLILFNYFLIYLNTLSTFAPL